MAYLFDHRTNTFSNLFWISYLFSPQLSYGIVRNAFGNYFDVLKEVTYSPLMAEMLTYNNGVSTGHAWIKRNKLHHADEVRFNRAKQFCHRNSATANNDSPPACLSCSCRIMHESSYNFSRWVSIDSTTMGQSKKMLTVTKFERIETMIYPNMPRYSLVSKSNPREGTSKTFRFPNSTATKSIPYRSSPSTRITFQRYVRIEAGFFFSF
jgi:hypothetical protein